MLTALHQPPALLAETSALLARVDGLLLSGVAAGQHEAVTAALTRIFADMSLALPLAALSALGQGQPRAFVALAAARTALQGALYDTLLRQARTALSRPLAPHSVESGPQLSTEPLAMSARHWLMELAIGGLARIDAAALLPFAPTVAQLRRSSGLAPGAFLLTGFYDELLAALPLSRPEELPLARLCDLWCAAMLAAPSSVAAMPEPASGTLYPLGIELRQAPQLVSIVVHGLLARGEGFEGFEHVRLTRSRYKVEALRGDELWLLFPEAAPLLECLAQSRALELRATPMLASGDLRWEAGFTPGTKYALADIARSLAPQANVPALTRPLPALDRHPVQIGEPVMLDGFGISGSTLQLAGGAVMPLDARWRADSELSHEALAGARALVGLLRFDAGRWAFQPLTAIGRSGKLTFAGQRGLALLKKPPKASAVAILEERASRLLRK